MYICGRVKLLFSEYLRGSARVKESAFMPVINGKAIDILFTEEQIARRNAEIATEIAAAKPQNLLVLGVLKGSFVFAADMIRALYRAGVSPQVEFITLSSYGSGSQSGEISLIHDIRETIEGRDILLIDDILESGRTLKFVADLLKKRQARSVAVAALLDKPMCRKAPIEADYVGFTCPDSFAVGYGMDLGHAFRELPFIGTVRNAPNSSSENCVIAA